MALTWTPPQPASFSTCRLQVSGPAFFSASHPVGIILPPGPVALNEPPTESKIPSLVLLQLCFGRFLLLPRNHLQGFESLVLIICQCVTSPGPASSTELMTHKVMPAMVRSIPATASAESRRGVWGWMLEGMGGEIQMEQSCSGGFYISVWNQNKNICEGSLSSWSFKYQSRTTHTYISTVFMPPGSSDFSMSQTSLFIIQRKKKHTSSCQLLHHLMLLFCFF